MFVGFFDDQAFRWQPSRHAYLDLAHADGATIVRTLIDWAHVAPVQPKRPANPFDPAYRLNDVNELVRNAQQRGMQVLFTIWGTPGWANGGNPPNVAPTNPRDLRDFAHALAARFSGRYPTFPFVRFYSVWNEPNSSLFLSPQFDANGAPVAPRTYAALVAAAYAGIKSASPDTLVAAGETAPRGSDRHVSGVHDQESPLSFARLVAAAAPQLPFDAWAHHPYPSSDLQRPDATQPQPAVGLADLGGLTSSLEHWFRRRQVRLWVTEFAYRTSPQVPNAAPYRLQASYLSQAVRLAREQPNVDMFVWFRFRDEAHEPWESGLLDSRGQAKPSLATFAAAANCYRLAADPCVQQGPKLTVPGDGDTDTFGSGIALSADGKTAVIAAPGTNGDLGAAWIFTRDGSRWSRGPELLPSDESGSGRVGVRVAISGDGSTVLLGAPWDSGGLGAAWIFVRSGSAWTQQGPKLIPADTSGVRLFGASVALSADGTTALIGAHGAAEGAGAAYVFVCSGADWVQQGAKLSPGDEIGHGRFGVSVALSADGSTALIGGWNDNAGVGAAWIFVRTGWSWSQQGSKLLPNDEDGAGSFGGSAALSADGGTALVGGEDDNGSMGAVWVFARTIAGWVQQGAKLTAPREIGAGSFGKSVGLTADGSTALVGASGDNGGVGAAWAFARSGASWSPVVTKLTGAGEVGAGAFGKNLGLAADGNTALIAGPLDDGNNGAAWAFVSSAPPSAQ